MKSHKSSRDTKLFDPHWISTTIAVFDVGALPKKLEDAQFKSPFKIKKKAKQEIFVF